MKLELYVLRNELLKEDNKDLNEDQKIYSRNVSIKELDEIIEKQEKELFKELGIEVD